MNVNDMTTDQIVALLAERRKLDAQEAANDPKKKSSSNKRPQTEGKGTPSTSKVLDKDFANAETPTGSEEETPDVGLVTEEKPPEEASDAESGEEKEPEDAEGTESGEDAPNADKKNGGNGQPPGDSGPEDSTSGEDSDSSYRST